MFKGRLMYKLTLDLLQKTNDYSNHKTRNINVFFIKLHCLILYPNFINFIF